MIIFDSYAWIEYFLGTDKGKIVESYFEKDKIITPSIVLVELSCKAEREDWSFKEYLTFIKSKSQIVGISEETIIGCGKIYIYEKNKKKEFGIIDAIILTTARNLNAKILTGDKHFFDIKEVVMI